MSVMSSSISLLKITYLNPIITWKVFGKTCILWHELPKDEVSSTTLSISGVALSVCAFQMSSNRHFEDVKNIFVHF